MSAESGGIVPAAGSPVVNRVCAVGRGVRCRLCCEFGLGARDYLRGSFLRGTAALCWGAGVLCGLLFGDFPELWIARGEFQIGVTSQPALAPFNHFAEDFAAGAFIAQKDALALDDLGLQVHHRPIVEDQCGLGGLGEKPRRSVPSTGVAP